MMGRKTYESIGKALKGRENIVISTTLPQDSIPNVKIFSSLEEAIISQTKRVIIIGGKSIYEQSLKLDIVDTIYRTLIHTTIQEDPSCFGSSSNSLTYFDIDINDTRYLEMESTYFPSDDDNAYTMTFQLFGRIR